MIAASDLNRLITLESYSYSQNDSGGLTPVLAEQLTDVWANIQQKGGDMRFNQAQMMADATYQITIRYKPQVTTNWNIIYEGQTYMINKIVLDNPAYKRFMIIDCSVSISQQSWS
jgi:SPP1 family predicted phage head-tail adaptor